MIWEGRNNSLCSNLGGKVGLVIHYCDIPFAHKCDFTERVGITTEKN